MHFYLLANFLSRRQTNADELDLKRLHCRSTPRVSWVEYRTKLEKMEKLQTKQGLTYKAEHLNVSDTLLERKL